MLELKNSTRFQGAIIPSLDTGGVEQATVLVKGTFDLLRRERIEIAEVQAAIQHQDDYFAEPGQSSIRYESDMCPQKPATDVVLVGHAYAPTGRCAVLDVELQAGALQQTVRVFGDRRWQRSLGSWRISPPAALDQMPLVYERAYGGVEPASGGSARAAYHEYNPVGTGFSASGSAKHLEGLALPNLELPGHPIRDWRDRPEPAGFGWINRDWMPRARYAGTYDGVWEEQRFPLLPLDFNARFFNGAHPRLVAPGYFEGGETVRVTNVSRQGPIVFQIPNQQLEATLSLKGVVSTHALVLDTIVIEPDANRLILCWRTTVVCPRAFLYLDYVQIRANR